MKKIISILLISCLSLITIFNFTGLLGKDNWFLDLFSHFKLQYTCLLTVGTIVLYYLKRDIKTLVFLIPILIIGIEVSSIYFGGNADVSIDQTLKICSANVLSSNSEFEKFGAMIRAEDPDVIILQEVNREWSRMTEQYLSTYTYQEVITREDNFGIGVYSKQPLLNIKKVNLVSTNIPSIQCDIKLGNKELGLLATHPLPPVGLENWESRNSQLKEIAQLAKQKTNLVVLGDLNTTSYSTHFKSLLEDGNLNDSRKGFGIHGSWPTWFSFASITLDHCLVSDDIVVKSRKIGRDIGSDHLPVFVEIGHK